MDKQATSTTRWGAALADAGGSDVDGFGGAGSDEKTESFKS